MVNVVPHLFKFIEKIEEKIKNLNPLLKAEQILAVFEVLEKIKIESDCRIDYKSDMSEVKFSQFLGYDEHFLELGSADCESSDRITYFTVKGHSFPEVPSFKYFEYSTTIEEHVANFRQYLEYLEEYYENVEKIDRLCFVVDPPKITTKTTWRIIKYNETVFLKMLIDPLNPTTLPELQFIGPVDDTQPLIAKLNEKMSTWDTELSVYDNFLQVFEIMHFAMQLDTEMADQTGSNCGICYAFRCEDRLVPLIACDNISCGKIFHISCLRGVSAKMGF